MPNDQWLDTPDSPGWWAFEGCWDIGTGEKIRAVFFVVEMHNVGLVFGYKDPIGVPLLPKQLFGKWRKLENLPWQETR